MTEKIIIILLLIALFYYYRKSQTQPAFLSGGDSGDELAQTKSANLTLTNFLRNQLNSSSLEELQTKLGEKTLDELLEENEDYETEVDTLTRTKNSLEQDLTAQAEAFQARLREKDREIKKVKEELQSSLSNLNKSRQDLTSLEKVRGQLTSEKQQHKGSLERIKLLTKQIEELGQEKRTNQTLQTEKERLEAELAELKKIPAGTAEQSKELKQLKERNQFYLEAIKTKEKIVEELKAETTQLQEQKATVEKDLNSILGK